MSVIKTSLINSNHFTLAIKTHTIKQKLKFVNFVKTEEEKRILLKIKKNKNITRGLDENSNWIFQLIFWKRLQKIIINIQYNFN